MSQDKTKTTKLSDRKKDFLMIVGGQLFAAASGIPIGIFVIAPMLRWIVRHV